VAYAFGAPATGAAAATGAMCVGFASQQGVYRTRAAAMLLTAGAMAISTLVGVVAGGSLPTLVVVTAFWGYAYGIAASLGPAATTVGINSVIALVVFGHFQVPVHQAFGLAGLVLAGGLVQTFLLVSVWPLRRFSAERHALAGAARSLAAYARRLAHEGPEAAPAAQPFATVRQTLADPQPFAQRGDIAAFQALLNELERVRASLGGLATDRERATDATALDQLAIASAGILESLARALDAGREPEDPDDDWFMLSGAEEKLEAQSSSDAHVRSEAHALAGQLRSAWRIAAMPAELPPSARAAAVQTFVYPSVADTIATLQANLALSSPYGRLAPRLAGTLAAATVLGGLLPTQHGYWIAMTATILLRPDFTTTFLRGVARVGGTLLGAALATAIAAHVRPGAETYVILCILFGGLGYAVFKANYGVFSVCITTYVVFALALAGQPEQTAVFDRVLATLVAAVLVGLAVLAWPTWEAGRARTALADLLDAQRRYARRVLEAYVDPRRYDAAAIANAQSKAWTQRTDAETSVDRMLGEPSRTRGIDGETALAILAASRRVGLAILSLSAHFPHAARVERSALSALVNALDDGFRCVVDAVREGTPCARYPHLRDVYRSGEKALPKDADSAMLLSVLDALVDSVNTLAELSA
jgi:uncharacterized membrane protein YccC